VNEKKWERGGKEVGEVDSEAVAVFYESKRGKPVGSLQRETAAKMGKEEKRRTEDGRALILLLD